jgi:glycosyltransferase involved in cell wall biosynthesis
MNGLVSVVIPNHNGGFFLKEALGSVINQTYPCLEIIVVDDGSTDNSLEILATFEGQIVLFKTKKLGAAAARNTGIKAARGEYIALLDSDDIWSNDKLQLQIESLESMKLDLVYCSGQEFGDSSSSGLIHQAKYSGDCYEYFKRFPTRGIIELGCSTAVFRTSILEFSGLFDESFSGAAEDWDFFRRYSKHARVGFCPEVLVRYRRHAGSITARSVLDYYLGNRHAILKMFMDDRDIRFFERRTIWIKFHYLSTKSFLKHGRIAASIISIFEMVLPIKP